MATQSYGPRCDIGVAGLPKEITGSLSNPAFLFNKSMVRKKLAEMNNRTQKGGEEENNGGIQLFLYIGVVNENC